MVYNTNLLSFGFTITTNIKLNSVTIINHELMFRSFIRDTMPCIPAPFSFYALLMYFIWDLQSAIHQVIVFYWDLRITFMQSSTINYFTRVRVPPPMFSNQCENNFKHR